MARAGKLKNWELIPHIGTGVQILWSPSAGFPGILAGNWTGSETVSTHMGCMHQRWQLNLVRYNASLSQLFFFFASQFLNLLDSDIFNLDPIYKSIYLFERLLIGSINWKLDHKPRVARNHQVFWYGMRVSHGSFSHCSTTSMSRLHFGHLFSWLCLFLEFPKAFPLKKSHIWTATLPWVLSVSPFTHSYHMCYSASEWSQGLGQPFTPRHCHAASFGIEMSSQLSSSQGREVGAIVSRSEKENWTLATYLLSEVGTSS